MKHSLTPTAFAPKVLGDEAGEFAGWSVWDMDVYEHETVGPFYFRNENDGPVTAFRAERRHLNGGNAIHGGALMSFADSALFTIAGPHLDTGYSGVTVAFNSEFLAAGRLGQYIEARGEVLRAGRSLIFVRGLVTADGKPCLNFSGTIKKLPHRVLKADV